MKLRHSALGLAGATMLFATTGIAAAQSPIKEAPVDPKAPNTGTGAIARPASGASPHIAIVLGWNRVHAYTCFLKTLSPATVQLISPSNEGVTLTSSVPSTVNMMMAACATGNLFSFYVTAKTSNTQFSFSNVQMWSVK